MIFSVFFAVVCALFLILIFQDQGRVVTFKASTNKTSVINEVINNLPQLTPMTPMAPMAPVAPVQKSVSPTQKLRDKITILAPKYISITQPIDLRRSG